MHDREEIESRALDPIEREIEAALQALHPTAPADRAREQMLFDAGVRHATLSFRRRVTAWRAAAGALAAGLVVSVSLHTVLVPRQSPSIPSMVSIPATQKHSPSQVELIADGISPGTGTVGFLQFAPVVRFPAESYGALQRQWIDSAQEDWLVSSRPVPAINPRAPRDLSNSSWNGSRPLGVLAPRTDRTPLGESL